MYKHALGPKTGLLYIGWEESKTKNWANPKTRGFTKFSGRLIGWYLRGLADVLDYFPKDRRERKELISIPLKESNLLRNLEIRKIIFGI